MQEFPRGSKNYTQSIDARCFLYTAHLHLHLHLCSTLLMKRLSVFVSALSLSLSLSLPSLTHSVSFAETTLSAETMS